MPHRQLKELVGRVGQDYLWQALPPRWIMLMGVLATLVGVGIAREPLAVLAMAVLAWSGLLRNWPCRRQAIWPGWRTAAMLLALIMERGDPGAASLFLQAAVVAATILAARHLLLLLHALHAQARRMDRVAGALDDDALLALLPPPARVEARRWQAGDDRLRARVSAVVRLAALWLATSCVRADADLPPRAVAVF